MFKKLIKVFKTIPYFVFRRTNTVLNKSLLIIEGPAALDLILLLEDKGSLPITFYVPCSYYATVKENTSKQHETVYLGPLIVFKSLCSVLYNGFLMRKNNTFLVDFELTLVTEFLESVDKNYNSVVVFNERMAVSNCATSWAKEHGIKSYCVQHGAIVENYFPVLVDIYFVWNQKFGEMISANTSKVSVIETGRLAATLSRRTLPRSLTPLVILQPNGVSISEDIVIKNFVEIIEECLDFYGEVFLRPHPNDNNLNQILTHFNYDERISISTGNLRDSLCSRHIAISLYSTVLLEAQYYGCVAVQYIDDSWYASMFYRTYCQIEGREELRALFVSMNDRSESQSVPVESLDPMFTPKLDIFLANIIAY